MTRDLILTDPDLILTPRPPHTSSHPSHHSRDLRSHLRRTKWRHGHRHARDKRREQQRRHRCSLNRAHNTRSARLCTHPPHQHPASHVFLCFDTCCRCCRCCCCELLPHPPKRKRTKNPKSQLTSSRLMHQTTSTRRSYQDPKRHGRRCIACSDTGTVCSCPPCSSLGHSHHPKGAAAVQHCPRQNHHTECRCYRTPHRGAHHDTSRANTASQSPHDSAARVTSNTHGRDEWAGSGALRTKHPPN